MTRTRTHTLCQPLSVLVLVLLRFLQGTANMCAGYTTQSQTFSQPKARGSTNASSQLSLLLLPPALSRLSPSMSVRGLRARSPPPPRPDSGSGRVTPPAPRAPPRHGRPGTGSARRTMEPPGPPSARVLTPLALCHEQSSSFLVHPMLTETLDQAFTNRSTPLLMPPSYPPKPDDQSHHVALKLSFLSS